MFHIFCLFSYFYYIKVNSLSYRQFLTPKEIISNLNSSLENKHLSIDYVKHFTNYHYYFKSSNKQSSNIFKKMISIEMQIQFDQCYLSNYNKTEHLITENLKYCPNQYYSPRIVDPSQISWKRVDLLNKLKQNIKLNNTNDMSHNLLNSTHDYLNKTISSLLKDFHKFQKLNQYTKRQSKKIEEENDYDDIDYDSTKKNNESNSKNETIHRYMAFGLLLPSHPFSDQMFYHLKVVSPMFPQVKLVVGNANKFKYLCNQYGVSSFPQLLFFTKGLLKSKFTKKMNPENLAYEFSKWTSNFPQSFPNIPSLSTNKNNFSIFSNNDTEINSIVRTSSLSKKFTILIENAITNITNNIYGIATQHQNSSKSTSNMNASLSFHNLTLPMSHLYTFIEDLLLKAEWSNRNNLLNNNTSTLHDFWDIFTQWQFGPFMPINFIKSVIFDQQRTENETKDGEHPITYKDTRIKQKSLLKTYIDLWHVYIASLLSPILQNIKLKYSLEPVLGTFDNSMIDYDQNGLLWFISGIYVLIHMLYKISSWYQYFLKLYYQNTDNDELLIVVLPNRA